MIENLGDKRSSNGFDKNPQNINKNGSKPSLDKRLQKLFRDDPEKLGKIVDKLESWVDSKDGSISLKAIQMIFDRLDGKAKQEIDAKVLNKTIQVNIQE